MPGAGRSLVSQKVQTCEGLLQGSNHNCSDFNMTVAIMCPEIRMPQKANGEKWGVYRAVSGTKPSVAVTSRLSPCGGLGLPEKGISVRFRLDCWPVLMPGRACLNQVN